MFRSVLLSGFRIIVQTSSDLGKLWTAPMEPAGVAGVLYIQLWRMAENRLYITRSQLSQMEQNLPGAAAFSLV